MPAYAATPYRDASSPGLLIFQIKGSKKGTFYFRFPLPGGGKWFEGSTKVNGPITVPCTPPSAAITMAAAEYRRVHGQLAAGAVATKISTVKDAADQYVADLKAGAKIGRVSAANLKNRAGFIRNYVEPYQPFAKLPVHAFDDRAREAWSKWALGDRQRTPSTLQKWQIYLGEVFDKAVALKWLAVRPNTKLVVEAYNIKDEKNVPHFTEEQWEAMKSAIPAFTRDYYKSDYDVKMRRLITLIAEISHIYGLRAGEAICVQWTHVRLHVEDGRTFYVLDLPSALKGHKSHIRTVIPLEWEEKRVAEIIERELPKYFSDCNLSAAGVLFQRPNGKTAGNVANIFDKWLKLAGVRSNFGKHCLTSFRHSYMNLLIEKTNIADGTIAQLAGTSVDMIRDHYRAAFSVRQLRHEREQRHMLKMLREQHESSKGNADNSAPAPEQMLDGKFQGAVDLSD